MTDQALPLDLSRIHEEEWAMLATLNAVELRATLRQLAKAQAAGDV